MYHPFFRGKQYELITIRETAALLANSKFVPIIEPVKESLGGLERTLGAVIDAKGSAIVVVNPHFGDHSSDGETISSLLRKGLVRTPQIAAGVLLRHDMTVKQALAYCDDHKDHPLTMVHAGFSDGKALAEGFGDDLKKMRHIFVEKSGYGGMLYRRHFAGADRVLVRDGFERRRNRDHPPIEKFSDLHVTFPDEGMNGFGDFLTVGDDYSESGGPAYAVAIHLTFIDSEKDDEMYIHHFKSIRQDTPTDPAGKFAEALDSMMKKLNEPNSKVIETTAVREFRELHAKRHFPGLGYVKKLSLIHHIETLADFFRRR